VSSPEGRDTVVRAAGGVVVRDGDHGVEVLLVHRPKYDDWSFPKGKRDPGERDDDTAVREVLEETGYRCRLGQELRSTSYVDSEGRDKRVRWWRMRVVDGGFTPNREVDEIAWLRPDEARARLTHPHDRVLLDAVEG
jgi:8-oxo-dGTP diphosphatase